jgi:hypothetical protein
MTPGLVQEHLNIIFKLFVATGCMITLEEVCNGNFGVHSPSTEPNKTVFGGMVEIAAKEW